VARGSSIASAYRQLSHISQMFIPFQQPKQMPATHLLCDPLNRGTMPTRDVLIIAHFTGDDENSNNRFNELARRLSAEGMTVEIATSSFSHVRKVQRNWAFGNHSYTITHISELGYRRNVSLFRLVSHKVMARNLERYLLTRTRPDVIYCAVPSLAISKIAAQYATSHGIRFVIDVQDLWPEAFQMVFDPPVLGRILYGPMRRKADSIYRSADSIVAVSKTYLRRAAMAVPSCSDLHVVYLGTDLGRFDELARSGPHPVKPSGERWIAYIGTLGHSYDLVTVIDAMRLALDRGANDLRLVVMGDGPLRGKFERYARDRDVPAEFLGRLDYGSMVRRLVVCDIAVNPIVAQAAQSVINKVADYAAAGLPVLNTQECEEYRDLLVAYRAGLNCKNGDACDLSQKLLLLDRDESLRKELGANNRRLAEEKFDRATTYTELTRVIRSWLSCPGP